MEANEILKKLSLEDKCRLLSGNGSWKTYTAGGVVPETVMSDGPHGLRKQDKESYADLNHSEVATCFPSASAIASSWDRNVAAGLARALAYEAKKEKVDVVLGPGTNIKRSPLCGRNFEYFSEDPYLAGEMAASYIRTMENEGVGSSLKHFACNSQETNRMTENSMVDERAMFEIYLPAFENAVKNGKPSTIMASYNRINGEYACANSYMLNDVLRNKWGYKGLVVSDWGATMDIVRCIKNGLDLEMPDSFGYHVQYLIDSVHAGLISEDEIDRAALSVIRLGLQSEERRGGDHTVDYNAHHLIAMHLEEECAVLLKKGNILPLGKDPIVIVVGEMAESMRYQGSGSSHITTIPTANAITSLEKLGVKVVYERGYDKKTEKLNEELTKQTLDTIRRNPGIPVLFFGGLTEISESEGYDRTTLDMPANQTALMKEILKETNDVAFIGFGGSAFAMPFADEVSDILLMHLGGQAVGEACARIITGEVNPSGKLSETYPVSLDDVPNTAYACVKTDDVQYRDSIFVGYRYYDTFDKKVAFPFGHGLSYTEFGYSDLRVIDNYTVSVKIKNTGSVRGKEVVQIYIVNPDSNIMRAKTELRGFAKVSLEPGEEKEVTVNLDRRAYDIYDVSCHDFVTVGGEYVIEAGSSIKDIRLTTTVVLSGTAIKANHRDMYTDYFKLSFNISEECFAKLYNKPLSHFDIKKKGEYTVYDSFERVCAASGFGRFLTRLLQKILRGIYKNAPDGETETKLILLSLYESPLDGLLGNSGGALKPGIIEALVLAANGHGGKAFLRFFTPTRKYQGIKEK